MKWIHNNIRTLAALLIASATLTACSSDDDESSVVSGSPADKPATVTMTVSASKATTRALALDGSTLNATWTAGDKVEVWTSDGTTTKYGELTAQSSGARTTLKGTLTTTPSDSQELLLKYLSPAYATQDGTLTGSANSIDKVCDYAIATVTATVYGDNVTATTASFVNQQAVVKFTLKNKANDEALSATALTVSDGTNSYTVKPASATSELYVAIPGFSKQTVTLTATVGSATYTYVKAGVTFANGQYYAITVKMVDAPYTLLSAATTDDIGKVVCAAGHLHTAKTAVPAGCIAVGILGCVTSTGHGLILALQDAANQSWTTINGWTSETGYVGWNSETGYASTTLKVLPDNTARGSLTSYTTLGETTVSNWAVAQMSDYQKIFENLGSAVSDDDGFTFDTNVNAYITTGVGGTALSDFYWSATVYNASFAWYFDASYWIYDNQNDSHSVRPVLGF